MHRPFFTSFCSFNTQLKKNNLFCLGFFNAYTTEIMLYKHNFLLTLLYLILSILKILLLLWILLILLTLSILKILLILSILCTLPKFISSYIFVKISQAINVII